MKDNNRFTNNEAENAGGALKWDDVEPKFANNIFSNNYAKLYGNDIACFA